MSQKTRVEIPIELIEEVARNIVGGLMRKGQKTKLIISGKGYKSVQVVKNEKKKNFSPIVEGMMRGGAMQLDSDEEHLLSSGDEAREEDIETIEKTIGEGKKKKKTVKKATPSEKTYIEAVLKGEKPTLATLVKTSGSGKVADLAIAEKKALEFLGQ